MHSIIKKEFAGKRVAFGNGGGPLGERTDLDDLAIIAHKSQDPNILRLFEKLPPLADLLKAKTDSAVAMLPKAKATTLPAKAEAHVKQ